MISGSMSEPPFWGQATGMLLMIAFLAAFCAAADRVSRMRGVRRIKRKVKRKAKGLRNAAQSKLKRIISRGR
jgi:hypothetical protein